MSISIMALIRSKTELPQDIVSAPPAIPAPADGIEATISGRVFNRVVDRSQKGIEFARGGIELDAIVQFSCRDLSSAMVAASGGTDLATGIPGHLIEEVHRIVCLRNTVLPAPAPGSGVKRMSILRKRPDISSETFQDQWFNLHSILVKRLAGIQGYRQNLVLDGPRDAAGHRMVDGVVELWFPDAATIESSFRSDIGITTMAHAREFISEIATFLVSPSEMPAARTT